MDRLDIKLLGQLARGISSFDFQPEVKAAYRRIACNLEVDEDTVRKRVERLRARGLIRAWQLAVNPNILGMTIFAIWMSVGPQLTLEEAIRKIKLVHGVISITHEIGDVLGVGLFCENEEVFKKRLGLISELVDARNVMTNFVQYPSPGVEVTKTDWNLIKRLRLRPTLSHKELANDLGLSTRTVKRRLTRLAQGKVIFFLPDIDLKLLEGAACVDLFVFYSASGLKGDVDRSIFSKFEDFILRAGWGSRVHGHFTFIVPSVTVAQGIVDWVRDLPGVREVRLSFIYEWILLYDEAWAELIAKKSVGS